MKNPLEIISDVLAPPAPDRVEHLIYLESNHPEPGQNAILAYRRGADGELTSLPGSPFLTDGKGVANPLQILGPNDLDVPLVATPDGRRMFAVNSGSNTIAVLDIAEDGALTPVAGSPFPSGGINPVSVGLAGNRLYVVNKNQDPDQVNDGKPNYTGFDIHPDGQLTPIPNSTIETVALASPSYAYVSPNQRLLFGADMNATLAPIQAGTLRAFTINPDGTLSVAPNSPIPIPDPGNPEGYPNGGNALGLVAHPTAKVLYVGFFQQGRVGVYSYDDQGNLTFLRAFTTGDAACWVRVNQAGTRLYTVNTAEATVSVHDISAPELPQELQKLDLKQKGPMFFNGGPRLNFASSAPFAEEISPDGTALYLVSQHSIPNFSLGNFNYLHVLEIDEDGLLSEPTEPLQLPVPNTARPQGVLVL